MLRLQAVKLPNLVQLTKTCLFPKQWELTFELVGQIRWFSPSLLNFRLKFAVVVLIHMIQTLIRNWNSYKHGFYFMIMTARKLLEWKNDLAFHGWYYLIEYKVRLATAHFKWWWAEIVFNLFEMLGTFPLSRVFDFCVRNLVLMWFIKFEIALEFELFRRHTHARSTLLGRL